MQKKLEKELRRLKQCLDLDLDLTIVYTPTADKALSGEVKGRCILIYESDEEEAFKTLRHEVIDYLIGRTIEPYKEVTNRLINMINEDAYKQKERIVEALTRLLARGGVN